MKILVVKFSPLVIKTIEGLPKDYRVVAVCDPDINGRLLAQHELPRLEYYADPSEAIQKSKCEAVLLTISDHAPQLALLAIAYGKNILWASGVTPGKYPQQIMEIARHAKVSMEIGL